MKSISCSLILIGLIAILNISNSCLNKQEPIEEANQLILAGSTPGGTEIKTLLGIKITDSIDFIKWSLTLNESPAQDKKFILRIHYGISKPNTNGFIEDGFKREYMGKYSVSSKDLGNFIGEVYQLNSNELGSVITLIRLDENLFHFLTKDNQLLLGNDGWNYDLVRKPLIDAHNNSSKIKLKNEIPSIPSNSITYAGRTPCTEIAQDNKLEVSEGCYKLKWKLILNRDTLTGELAKFELFMINRRQSALTGKVQISKSPGHGPALIYTLLPDNSERPIRFLTLDQNILFFLDNNGKLYAGNEEFSYALNRRL